MLTHENQLLTTGGIPVAGVQKRPVFIEWEALPFVPSSAGKDLMPHSSCSVSKMYAPVKTDLASPVKTGCAGSKPRRLERTRPTAGSPVARKRARTMVSTPDDFRASAQPQDVLVRQCSSCYRAKSSNLQALPDQCNMLSMTQHCLAS